MEDKRSWFEEFRKPILAALQFVALLWMIHTLRILHIIDWPASSFGVYPRRLFGLSGIITSPLVHSDWKHLLSNSIPLLAMITVIWSFFRKVSWQAFIMIYILTGVSVWLFARPVFHIGASGVVYGLVAFVFWSGVFRRSLKSIVLALIVILVYTPMFAGVLPTQEGISWESHLLGGLTGIFVAWWFRADLEPEEHQQPKLPEEDKTPYFERDIFEQTRDERRLKDFES